MARPRLITVGCLNISNPNESANIYNNIISAAFRLRRPIKLSAHKFVILNQLTRDRLGVRGSFARYNEIDPNLPWFDIRELDEADDEATREISIPDNLRPNFVPFFFHFDSQRHKLFLR